MFSAREQANPFRANDSRDSAVFSGRMSPWMWAIIVVGAVLRLIAIGYKSFWIDEIASVAIARRVSATFWHFLWHDEGNMAAYYVLLRPWLHFGYGEGTVRLLSVLPGIAAIPLLYRLTRSLFDARIATTAALFLSFNACAVYISQEARAYSFVVFFVLLSTCFFVLLIERPSYRAALAYAIIAAVSCYFHYFCVLVPAAHYTSLVGAGKVRRLWSYLLFAAGVIALGSAPILWLMHAQDTGHISWVQPTSWLEAYHLGAYLSAASGKAVGGVLLALDLVLIGFFFNRWSRSWSDGEARWRYSLAASLLITPIVITVSASILRPAFYHRFLIVCLPGWILMTAIGVQAMPTRQWRTAAIVGVCGLSLASTVILYYRVTEDWRGAVNYQIAHAQPNDRLLYYQPVGEFAAENYRDWLPGGSGPRPVPIAVNADGSWKQGIDDTRQIWLVLYRAKVGDVEVDGIQQQLEQLKFALNSIDRYRGVTVLHFIRR